jgi:hypothetical protein
MNTISIIDNNFRDSLQNHHYYHWEKGNISEDNILYRDIFDYKNIHNKLGNVYY